MYYHIIGEFISQFEKYLCAWPELCEGGEKTCKASNSDHFNFYSARLQLFVTFCNPPGQFTFTISKQRFYEYLTSGLREGVKKIDFFLGKSPKLWVGGGQES